MSRILSFLWKTLRSLGPVEWLVSYTFGDDIFISYSRRGGIRYAEQLAHVLSAEYGLSCRADFRQTRTGRTMPDELWRALRRSRTLVIIGSENALKSANVGREVEFYLQTHPTKMNIVPVDFEQKVQTADWYKLIEGLPPGPVESSSTLEEGSPSDNVVTRINESLSFQRRNRRILYASVTSLTIVLMLLVVGAAASGYAALMVARATNAIAKATAAEIRAATATAAAQAAQIQAAVASAQANASQAEARAYQSEASEQARLADKADHQRVTAERATVRARKLEQEARANAIEQTQVANASRLAGRADRNIAQKPDLSFLLSSTALKAHPKYATLEARRSLLTGLASYERLNFILHPPSGEFKGYVAAPDNKTLITIGDELIFWDLEARKPRSRVSGSGLKRIILSADGRTTAVMGEREVSIWDVQSESRRGTIQIPATDLFNFAGDVDPKRDVIVTPGRAGELVLRDFSDFDHIAEHRFRYDQGNIGDLQSAENVTFSPNGETIFVAGAMRHEPPLFRDTIRTAVRRWDVTDLANPKPLDSDKQVDANQTAITSLRFRPDGKYFLTTDSLNHIKLWDAQTLENRLVDADPNVSMYEPAFSADSSSFTTGTHNDGAITTLSVDQYWVRNDIPKPVGSYKRGVSGGGFSHDGTQVITLNLDGTIAFWRRTGTNELTSSLTSDEKSTTSLAFSADGTLMAVGDSAGRILIAEGAPVRAHASLATTILPAPLNSTDPDLSAVLSLDFHPTRKMLVAAYTSGALVRWTWDRSTGWQPSQFPVGDVPYTGTLGLDATPIASFAHFADSGSTLISICKGSQVVLWDYADDLEQIPRIKAIIRLPERLPRPQDLNMANTVASPEGDKLVVGDNDGLVHVLDVKNRKWLPPLKGSTHEIRSIAISHDGGWVAAVDDEAEGFLWRIEARTSGVLCRRFKIEVDFPDPTDVLEVRAIAFDRQDTTLAIGSSSMVTFWDVASSTTLGSLDIGMDGFKGLMFSPDGRDVVAIGGNPVLLEANSESWARVARRMANRELSAPEVQDASGDTSANPCPTRSPAETNGKNVKRMKVPK